MSWGQCCSAEGSQSWRKWKQALKTELVSKPPEMSTVTILRELGLWDLPNLMGLLLLRLVRPLIFTIIVAFHFQAYHRGREKWWDWATLNAVKLTVPTKFQLFFLNKQSSACCINLINFQNSDHVYFWQFWPLFSLFWWKSRFSGALNLLSQKITLSLANVIITSWKILPSHDINKSIYILLNDLPVLAHMNAFT